MFPHAPVRPVTINGGMRMRAWYDILNLDDIDSRVDEAGIEQSAAAVEALLAREAQRGVPRSRVVLAGFSQGGAIALTVALRSEEPLAGLVGAGGCGDVSSDALATGMAGVAATASRT